jgi:hypothetical protein
MLTADSICQPCVRSYAYENINVPATCVGAFQLISDPFVIR